jgi:hypothetical protein
MRDDGRSRSRDAACPDSLSWLDWPHALARCTTSGTRTPGFEPDSYILSSETRRIASSTTDTRETVAMVTLVIVIVLPAWFFLPLYFLLYMYLCYVLARARPRHLSTRQCAQRPPPRRRSVSLSSHLCTQQGVKVKRKVKRKGKGSLSSS